MADLMRHERNGRVKTVGLNPVLRVASESADAFRLAVTSNAISYHDRHDLKTQHARFNIWYSSITALAHSNENATFGKRASEMLRDMLNRLSQKVQTLIESENQVETIDDEQTSETSSILNSSSDSSESEDEDVTELELARHPSLAFIDNIISRLYRYDKFILVSDPTKAEWPLHAFENLSLGSDDEFGGDARRILKQECPGLLLSSRLYLKLLAVCKGRRRRLLSRKKDLVRGKVSNGSLVTSPPDENFTDGQWRRWSTLCFPPFPKATIQDRILCSYCGLDITDMSNLSFQQRQFQWRHHVLTDIDPYVCLFSDCGRDNEPFNSAHAWLLHMREHCSDYFCQFVEHESIAFTHCNELELHLSDKHSESIPHDSLSQIAKKGEKPSEDILTHLLLDWNNEKFIGKETVVCIFCGKRMSAFIDLVSSKDRNAGPVASTATHQASINPFEVPIRDHLRRGIFGHIISHLEAVALFSLPHITSGGESRPGSESGFGSELGFGSESGPGSASTPASEYGPDSIEVNSTKPINLSHHSRYGQLPYAPFPYPLPSNGRGSRQGK